MRRLFALLLIATSGWLLYQTANAHLGGIDHVFSPTLKQQASNPGFLFPAIGGVMGLLGGLTVFFNGPGGAAIAMIGGVAVAGFTLTLKQTFELDHILDNEFAVGAAMLMLAGMTATISRPRKPSRYDDADRPYASGRRIY